MSKKLTLNEFIIKSNDIHNNKYDYSLVNYINIKTKVLIICKKHGIFSQTPKSHLSRSGCIKCNKNILSNVEFIEKVKNIHGNFLNYTLVNYKNIRTTVDIICPEHGILKIKPYNLLHNKIVCDKCDKKRTFIEKSITIHNNKYDYSLVNYKNSHLKVKIICPIHGVFEQLPYHHLYSLSGCPKCNKSKGEVQIEKILIDNNISYVVQKKFNDCKYVNHLKFDFYLPDYNTCIEFDGEQHFMIKEHWGGKKEFKNIQKRDQLKTEYCEKNNIKLLRINYKDIKNINTYFLSSNYNYYLYLS